MPSRLASDDEVETWREEGWVLLDDLVGTDEIDAAADDLHLEFPAADDYHADPEGVTAAWKGRPAPAKEDFAWPDDGPGFRADQHRWMAAFPFAGAALNRLCIHPSIIDFAERALGAADIRLYQAHASAKYSGLTNYEQPMHTDRNHSWLPAGTRAPWWNLQGFLYLSDVTDADNPTRLVSVRDSAGATENYPLVGQYGVIVPGMEPDLYPMERRAPGGRGSYLAYRSDVFHRGAPFASARTARFVMGLAFKRAGQDWIGYDTQQSVSTSPAWTTFVEGLTPRQLELFGFPPPGHPIWDEALVEATALRYPGLDIEPWRTALPPV
jgi:hypothetical protein